ncbi:MAG TPA: nitroreductase family protein [Tetragenococcus sp.]|nr:nitroreductase family protein [Tetragenococcus sp.]
MVDFKNLVVKDRSYRRFYENEKIGKREMLKLIDCARLTASGQNHQGMRYRLVCSEKECEKLFATLAWAALYKEWEGPKKGQRPAAYILCVRDKSVNKNLTFDDGIVASTITLAAAANGIGSCILQNCQYQKAFEALGIDPERYAFSCVIALGHPSEKVVLEEMKDDQTNYWKTSDDVHHVPKRRLEDILL